MTEKSLEETLLEITEKALASNTPIVLRGEVVRKQMNARELLELTATDRELLELAAKAAGIELTGADRAAWLNRSSYGWNPLDDDGDALRLAVGLALWIFTPDIDDLKVHVRRRDDKETVAEKVLDDPYAATRRAIVRAAAEIGRNMT